MKLQRFARPVLLVCLALVLGFTPAAAGEKKANFATSLLDQIEIGEPLVGKVVMLFPLRLKGAVEDPAVVSEFATEADTFVEPEFPDQRYGVTVRNASDKPLFVLGGTVLVGGERDRLLRHDCIIPANGEAEMRALPAASTSDIRKDIVPFQAGTSIAPLYLRKQADFGGSSTLVPTFVSRNLEFRNQGDKRKSLAAIGQSDILQAWNAEAREKLDAAVKTLSDKGSIVGVISAMRGRVQGLELFGSRRLLTENSKVYLLGATYAAAAIAIQAGRKKIPMPGSEDPEKTQAKVTKDAHKLLEMLRKARFKKDKQQPDGSAGQRLLIQLSDRTRGRAVGVDGKLVHLAIYPHDPVSAALYGSKLRLPKAATGEEDAGESDDDGSDISSGDRMGLAQLSRWAGRGHRLTHAEQNLVGGLRGGRGTAGGLRGGMGGGRRR